MSDHLVVLTTTDSKDAAEALARAGIESRVAACAQVIGPIGSMYWWDGDVQNDTEYQVWFKTTVDGYSAVEACIKTHHTYDTPEVIALPIPFGSPEYLTWVSEETAT